MTNNKTSIESDWGSPDISFDEMLVKYNLKEHNLRKIIKGLNLPKKTKKIPKLDKKEFIGFEEMWLNPSIKMLEIVSKSKEFYKKTLHEDTLRKWAKELNLPTRDHVHSLKYQISLLPNKIQSRISEMWEDKTYTIDDISVVLGDNGINSNHTSISMLFDVNKSSKTSEKMTQLDTKEFTEIWTRSETLQHVLDYVSGKIGVTTEPSISRYAAKLGLPKRPNNPIQQATRRDATISSNEHFIRSMWSNNEITVQEISSALGFKTRKTLYDNIQHLNLPKKATNSGTSAAEREIVSFIRTFYQGEIIINDREFIAPHEIDILIPEKKLAIEHNGVRFHSIGTTNDLFNTPDTNEERSKHLKKTEAVELLGYQLLHISGDEWINKRKQWQNVIKNSMGESKHRIGARKTEVRKVSIEVSKKFLENNHLQGSTGASVKLGLFYDNQLVSLMTLSKGRQSISQGAEWELIRFCSKSDYTIQGGASKLFKYFVKHYQPQNVTSFANRRWSKGNLYQKMGFTLSHNSSPNYFYFINPNKMESRNKFQKHKLVKMGYSKDETEWEIMNSRGYRKIYDSGNCVYKWSQPSQP